jgi:hypothetical protein
MGRVLSLTETAPINDRQLFRLGSFLAASLGNLLVARYIAASRGRETTFPNAAKPQSKEQKKFNRKERKDHRTKL